MHVPETRNRYSGVFEMFGWRFQGVAIRFQMAARPSDSAAKLAGCFSFIESRIWRGWASDRGQRRVKSPAEMAAIAENTVAEQLQHSF